MITNVKSFIGAILSYAPALAGTTFTFMLLAGIFEGVGLLMLIPVLGLLGIGAGDGGSNAIVGQIETLLADLAIPLETGPVLAAFVVVLGIRSFIKLINAALTVRLTTGYLHHVRLLAYKAISQADWLFLARQKSAGFAQILTTQSDHISNGAVVFLRGATSLASAAAGLVVAWLIAPKLTGLAIILALAISIPMLAFDFRAYRLGGRTWEAMKQIFEQITKHLGGFKSVKIHAADASFLQDFSRLSTDYKKLSQRQALNWSQANLVHELAGAIMLAVFVYLAVSMTGPLRVEPIMLVIVFARVLPKVFAIQSDFRILIALTPEHEALMKTIGEARAAAEPVPHDSPPLRLEHSLVFDRVSFAYPGDTTKLALENVSLEIPAFCSVGIIGLSGAGKTTLADLAAGLFAPTEGSIAIDGAILDAANRTAWRSSISYILQEEFLFNDTIRANLLIGHREATDDDLWRALDLARARDMVDALADGLATIVGDHGVLLSRGQRQRLCLARGLIRLPDLLILDEATSALNPVDEIELIEILKGLTGQTTVLMIAHRPSSIAWTDRVIVLQEARLIEQGSLSDLAKDSASFTHAMLAADANWQQAIADPSQDLS